MLLLPLSFLKTPAWLAMVNFYAMEIMYAYGRKREFHNLRFKL